MMPPSMYSMPTPKGLILEKPSRMPVFIYPGAVYGKRTPLYLGVLHINGNTNQCFMAGRKKGRHQWYTGRKETTIWEFDKPKRNGDHPTMKPIPLLAYPILNSSMSNTIILDPFGGSGSTLIACEQSERICYTVELDEKFCDVIVKRYIEQVGTSKEVSVQRDGLSYRYDELKETNE